MAKAAPPADSFKRPESVLVVVTSSTGEVLLLQRADSTDAWQSVTGSLKWEEHAPLEAARRELAEETGLKESGRLRDWQQANTYAIHPLWQHRYAPGVTHNTEHVFSLELGSPRPITINPREHRRWLWVSYAEAIDRIRFATNRQAVETLYRDWKRDRD